MEPMLIRFLLVGGYDRKSMSYMSLRKQSSFTFRPLQRMNHPDAKRKSESGWLFPWHERLRFPHCPYGFFWIRELIVWLSSRQWDTSRINKESILWQCHVLKHFLSQPKWHFPSDWIGSKCHRLWEVLRTWKNLSFVWTVLSPRY